MDLVGAAGSLDFDMATGDAPIDLTVTCLGKLPGSDAQGAVESGLVYNPQTRKLEGSMHCE